MRIVAIIAFVFSFYVFAQDIAHYLKSNDIVKQVGEQYGKDARLRVNDWLSFIDSSISKSEWRQIHLVNDFFNKNIEYKTDIKLWLKKDYWATPIETLGAGMGDCEDYVIAKYFTLIALGVPEHKIRLMYVRQLTVNQPHMVLIYLEEPGNIPFVLDNFNNQLLPANLRTDLKPIYSFNGQGLWLAKAKGLGRKVENSKGVSAWNTMLERIEQGKLAPLTHNNKGTDSYVANF